MSAALPEASNDTATVSSAHPINPDALDALIHMTPLLFNVDTERIDWSGLTHVTVEAEVLIGTFE